MSIAAHRRPCRALLHATVGVALVLAAGCTATTATSAATATTATTAATGKVASSTSLSSPATAVTSAATTTTTASSPALTADQPVPRAPANDLAKSSAHRVLAIDGEVFKLKVDYWTTVESTSWDATGAKNVHLLAYVQPASGVKAPEVVIDRFSPAFALLASNTGLNGVPAGTTVDPGGDGGATDAAGVGLAGSALPGFLITSTVSYGSQFGTAGVSDVLAERWQQLAPHQALSEAALQRAGVYAVRVSMTYLLLVRNVGDPGWHRRTVVDTLTVPVKPRT